MASSSSEPVLGIDLGTTFSTAALVVNGKFRYATDDRGEACIPSVVHFPKSGPPLVGVEADRLRATDPENTVCSIKRVLGRGIDSPQARRVQASNVFKLVAAGDSEVKVRTRTGDYAASEIAALIMRHLKDRSQQRFGQVLSRAVVTVPVLASPHVRNEMVRIGRMAGLEVVRVISEPVAGALARGITGAQDVGAPRLVFDFGGGTLDVTLVQHVDGRVRVLAAGGDDSLGGDDFDTAFARSIASHVWGQTQVDVMRDAILSDAITRTCERVKRALSAAPSARYFIPEALGVTGRKWNIELTITREMMSRVWLELINRSIEVTQEMLNAGSFDSAKVSMVSLIGGTTFVPQVRDAVATAFRRPLDLENDPQTAVARGAAFLGAFPQLIK